MKRRKKGKKKMAPNVKAYLATLKRAKSLALEYLDRVDKKEHEAIKRYHRIS